MPMVPTCQCLPPIRIRSHSSIDLIPHPSIINFELHIIISKPNQTNRRPSVLLSIRSVPSNPPAKYEKQPSKGPRADCHLMPRHPSTWVDHPVGGPPCQPATLSRGKCPRTRPKLSASPPRCTRGPLHKRLAKADQAARVPWFAHRTMALDLDA